MLKYIYLACVLHKMRRNVEDQAKHIWFMLNCSFILKGMGFAQKWENKHCKPIKKQLGSEMYHKTDTFLKFEIENNQLKDRRINVDID